MEKKPHRSSVRSSLIAAVAPNSFAASEIALTTTSKTTTAAALTKANNSITSPTHSGDFQQQHLQQQQQLQHHHHHHQHHHHNSSKYRNISNINSSNNNNTAATMYQHHNMGTAINTRSIIMNAAASNMPPIQITTSKHHSNSNNNNYNSNSNNNNDNTYTLTKTTGTTAMPSPPSAATFGGGNSNNNNNNNNNVTTTIEEFKATANAKAISTRNKSEEAISDLRQRIPEIDNIFDVHSRIGNGTFSTVLLGTLKKERELPEHMKRKFAIKHHIPTSHPDRIMKELQCMAKIGGSENVVGINCCIRYNESVAFIMPYMQHDRFHDFFSKMDISEVQFYMKNLLIALRHVHKFNVIHRDVKPSNFLYNRRKRQFLLVDFGLAQQVPSQQVSVFGASAQSTCPGITNNAYNAATGQPQTPLALDGKRSRELDDSPVGTGTNTKTSIIEQKSGETSNNLTLEVGGVAKRLRCTGPQGDQQIVAAAAAALTATRGTTSCSIVSNSGATFKMPLKQLNEISGKGITAQAVTVSGIGNVAEQNEAICGDATQTLSRQVKSAVLSGRLQQKSRAQQQQQGIANASNATLAGTNTASAIDAGNVAAKYNTNANAANASKCFCYGNPQVCNICLIKKEIHASRAGTPGYRPPEVLLKYPDQTTAVDVWAAGVIFLSILSSVYPFFKAPNDYVALAEMVTIFGDKTIRKTAFVLDRLVTLSQKTKPLDLRKLCVRFRNRTKFSSPELLRKYQRKDGTCEVCKNCDQFYFNCLCSESHYKTEPFDSDDLFPPSAYDLLYKLLEVNPHKRITAEEALNHPFFTDIYSVPSFSGSSTPAEGHNALRKRRD